MSNKYKLYASLLGIVFIFLFSSCNRKANIYIYKSNGDQFNFPESRLNLPSTGVCFSGGGTRAMTCAAGQMKALDSLGLWDHLGYISSVSGGNWASAIFTYYQPTKDGPKNDEELLGFPYGPQNLTLSGLREEVPKKQMIHAVTKELTGEFLELLAEDDLSLGLLERSSDVWIDAVGNTYLKPFGLYHKNRRYFTLDEASRDDIIKRAPKLKLKESDFYLVHQQKGDANRPYLLMNSSLMAPASFLPLREKAKFTIFNYSPLGVGSANLLNITHDSRFNSKRSFLAGGGFIEPFGLGGTAPLKSPEACGDDRLCATVKVPVKRRFSLAHASGTSSAAFAGPIARNILGEAVTDLLALGSVIPEERYYAIVNEEPASVDFRFADGGSLENFGVLTLLQRKVKKIAVFINTDVAIKLDYDPVTQDPDSDQLDYDFYSLFADFTHGVQINNHVFTRADFVKVVKDFQTCLRNGTTVMSKLTTTTVPNEWWGIGAQEVEILWVYNEKVPAFEKLLPEDIQVAIAEKDGPFPSFPLYGTFFPWKIPNVVELSPEMAKLLYELQFWNVYSNREVFEFLRTKD